MNVYILDRVDTLTWNWHEDGGLVVIARDIDDAKAQVEKASTTSLYSDDEADSEAPRRPAVTDDEWGKAKVLPLIGEHEPAVHVFPDAGCC